MTLRYDKTLTWGSTYQGSDRLESGSPNRESPGRPRGLLHYNAHSTISRDYTRARLIKLEPQPIKPSINSPSPELVYMYNISSPTRLSSKSLELF